MAGNFHLSPNAYSSGFDSDDSENAPIITFTQEVRNLPPKRILKKKKVLDDEDEGPPKGKRAPLKDKNDKAARHPEKTQRSPRKGKFGASPKPKKVKKVNNNHQGEAGPDGARRERGRRRREQGWRRRQLLEPREHEPERRELHEHGPPRLVALFRGLAASSAMGEETRSRTRAGKHATLGD